MAAVNASPPNVEHLTPTQRRLVELLQVAGPLDSRRLADYSGLTPQTLRKHLCAIRQACPGLLASPPRGRPAGGAALRPYRVLAP